MAKKDGMLYSICYYGMRDRFEVIGYKPRPKTWELIDALPEPLFFALADGIRNRVDSALENIANKEGYSPSARLLKSLKAIQKRDRREGVFEDGRIDKIIAKHEQGLYAEDESNV